MARKKNDNADPQPSTVAIQARPTTSWLNKRNITLLLVLLAGVAIGAIWLTDSRGNDKSTELAEEHTLQTSLSIAMDSDDEQAIVSTTTQLITGASSGQFTISKPTLAQYHLDKANALYNLKQYNRAVTEYGLTRQVDNSLELATLEGEAQARFALGERQQLIPMLQQIVQSSKQQEQPGRDINGAGNQVIAEYSADITALQNNQKVQQL